MGVKGAKSPSPSLDLAWGGMGAEQKERVRLGRDCRVQDQEVGSNRRQPEAELEHQVLDRERETPDTR